MRRVHVPPGGGAGGAAGATAGSADRGAGGNVRHGRAEPALQQWTQALHQQMS